MTNNLQKLFEVSGKKNYEFHYKITDEKENTILLDDKNKIIEANIGDPEHKDLPKLIDDLIKKLQ